MEETTCNEDMFKIIRLKPDLLNTHKQRERKDRSELANYLIALGF
jgi:hypothetical protein